MQHILARTMLFHNAAPIINETYEGDNLIQSAVIVPLFKINSRSEIKVLLTQRQTFLRSHPGQFSFPGGKFDPQVDSNLSDTALRECHEEIGIKPSVQRIIKPLRELSTLTGFSIKPFLSCISSLEDLKINPSEVLGTLAIPLSFFCQGSNCYKLAIGKSNEVFFYCFEGNLIWGATAKILFDLASQISVDPASFHRQVNYL